MMIEVSSGCLMVPREIHEGIWDDKNVVDVLINDNGYVTEREYWKHIECSNFDTFGESFITEHGDVIEVFGYYGYDG